MRIDRRLYIVIPIYESGEDSPVLAYVHSMPLAEEVVDRYFMTLGRTYTTIFSSGLGLAAGPAHAMRVLRATAEANGEWFDDPKAGKTGVQTGVVEEVRRLTMVAALHDGKWEQLPLAVAVDRGVLTAEDLREVENAIVFFIVSYATLDRKQRGPVLSGAAALWGAQISSLSFTEWVSSLKTSTATGNSGEKSPAAAKESSGPAPAPPAAKRSSVPI